VELNIFNVQGILVKKLIAEPLQQGNYSIAWNGDDNYGRPLLRVEFISTALTPEVKPSPGK
jgi:hypothetical protein